MAERDLPDSAYMRAALQLLARIAAALPDRLPDPVRAILVRGAAVHVHTRARVSNDIEAVFSHRLLLPQDLLVRYTDEAGNPRTLAYDYNYFADIALMHPDFECDAVPLGQLADGRLLLAVIAPLDLAVSKIARFQDVDRADIAALARHGLVTPQELAARAEEALACYVGDDRWVRYNLADAVKLVEQSRKAPHAPDPR